MVFHQINFYAIQWSKVIEEIDESSRYPDFLYRQLCIWIYHTVRFNLLSIYMYPASRHSVLILHNSTFCYIPKNVTFLYSLPPYNFKIYWFPLHRTFSVSMTSTVIFFTLRIIYEQHIVEKDVKTTDIRKIISNCYTGCACIKKKKIHWPGNACSAVALRFIYPH